MADQTSWLRKFRASEAFITATVSVALFTDEFIYGLVVPVIPRALIDRAGVSHQDVQKWISFLLAAYGASLTIGSPLFGYLTDRHRSRKIYFVVGLIALALSSALFVIGVSPVVLVVARALQGLSGACVGVVGMAFLGDTVGEDHTSRAMGYAMSSMSLGIISGPMTGGIIFAKFGYVAVFIIPIVLTIVDTILRLLVIERGAEKDTKTPSNPPTDAVAQQRQDAPTTAGPSENTPLLSSASRSNEEESETTPMLFQLLAHPRMIVALFATMVGAVVITSFESTLPLFVTQQFHWDSMGAGLIFLAFSLPTLSGSLIGDWIDRGASPFTGPVAISIEGIALLSLRFVSSNTTVSKAVLVGLLPIIGLAITIVGVTQMTNLCLAAGEVEERHPDKGERGKGLAFALLNMSYAAGQFIGPVLGGFTKEYAGWGGMTLVLGLICLGTAALMALSVARDKKRTNKTPPV
ncbi:hypothetical protein VTN02DRAFT_5175 [Thermoascus thermophilus]